MKPLIKAFALAIFLPFLSSAQSKKSDKKIEAALKSHLSYLALGPDSGKIDQKKTYLYLVKQFEKIGLKPAGDHGTWYQKFTIDHGRIFLPSSSFAVNGKPLKLADEFFPFSFSVNCALHSSVAMALSENGVPWFVELKDIIDTSYTHSATADTLANILAKADKSAAKGATALIVYNRSLPRDLVFTPVIQAKLSAIPVIYVSKKAVRKHFSDESESLDIRLNSYLKESTTEGEHIVGYIDNGADSTIVVGASITNNENIAALIEISRLLKKKRGTGKNYLFVAAVNPEANEYFALHPSAEIKNMRYVMNLDTFSSQGYRNGLNKVNGTLQLLDQH